MNGIATGIAFPGPITPGDRGIEWGRKTARAANEFSTRIGLDHPGRFGLFASLPMEDVEGCLQEIEYAQDVLKADGFGIVTNYGDLWLGDTKFEPIYSELNRRNAVVFVHPTDAPCCTPDTMTYMNNKNKVSEPWIEWPMNTARTIFSLIASGMTRKYPNIRFIFCHGGGVMPLLVGRVDGLTGLAGHFREIREATTSLFPNGLESEYKKLYFECAQSYAPANMAALLQLVPSSQLLFGSDYNRFPISHSVERWQRLSVPGNVRQALDRGNAEELLPRWRA